MMKISTPISFGAFSLKNNYNSLELSSFLKITLDVWAVQRFPHMSENLKNESASEVSNSDIEFASIVEREDDHLPHFFPVTHD